MTQINKNSPERENSDEGSHISNNKLLEFQKQVSAISKDSVNPFFKSKYFDVNTVIDTIKPILNKVGLVVTQPLGFAGDQNLLHTQVLDGDRVIASSSVILPKIDDVQKFGAAITYYRRYALVSLLLLQGEEDDDGNKVAPQAPKTVKSQNIASNSDGNAMTPKQNAYIHVLMKEKGIMHLSEIGIEKIEKPTMIQAKEIIDKLLAYKPEDKIIQIDEPPFEDGDMPQ